MKLNKVKKILEEYKTKGRYIDTLKELSMSSKKKKRYSRKHYETLEEVFEEYLMKYDSLDFETIDKAIEDFTESLKNKTFTQIYYAPITSFINPYYLIKKDLLTIEELNEKTEKGFTDFDYSVESEKDIIEHYVKINSLESYLNKAIETVFYKYKVSKITQKYVEIERDSCLFFNKNTSVDFSPAYYSKFKISKDLFTEFYELSLNEPVLIVFKKNKQENYIYFTDFETFEKLEPLFQKYLTIYNYNDKSGKICKYFSYKMSLKYLQSVEEVKKNLEKDIETFISKFKNIEYPSLETMLKHRYELEKVFMIEERKEILNKIAELKKNLSSLNEYIELASKTVKEFENLKLSAEEKIVYRYIIDLFLRDRSKLRVK